MRVVASRRSGWAVVRRGLRTVRRFDDLQVPSADFVAQFLIEVAVGLAITKRGGRRLSCDLRGKGNHSRMTSGQACVPECSPNLRTYRGVDGDDAAGQETKAQF